MNTFLKQTFDRLLTMTSLTHKRALYDHFKPGRLTGLVGPRGVGKTTLLLQYIKEHHLGDDSAFYFSADAVYFQQTTLLEFVNELYLTDGIRYFFIDEIHKYKNWNQELKNIYDSFPDISVIFSGSSMLDLVGGSYDLSRRANLYHLPGLSFREYLSFSHKATLDKITLPNLLSQPSQLRHIAQIKRIKGLFKDYLNTGYYPFVFSDPATYNERLQRVVEKTIYEDIANFFQLKTENLHTFKKILAFLASIPPGEVNTHNIAQNLQTSHQTVAHYLDILQQVHLIRLIYPAEGGNQRLRKPAKIMLNNTNLLHTLALSAGCPINTGTLRETYFIQALADAGLEAHYSKIGDYSYQDTLFEIGGPNKKYKQLRDTSNPAYMVKDNTLLPSPHCIPLLYFGFLS
jgi:hypothetical protein